MSRIKPLTIWFVFVIEIVLLSALTFMYLLYATFRNPVLEPYFQQEYFYAVLTIYVGVMIVSFGFRESLGQWLLKRFNKRKWNSEEIFNARLGQAFLAQGLSTAGLLLASIYTSWTVFMISLSVGLPWLALRRPKEQPNNLTEEQAMELALEVQREVRRDRETPLNG